jgi:indolepyruvate ferredoxin oxidoreductase alpha subunit
VGCGVCGEVSHAAVLCPSFYRARIVANPGRLERVWAGMVSAIIARWQARAERGRLARAF